MDSPGLTAPPRRILVIGVQHGSDAYFEDLGPLKDAAEALRHAGASVMYLAVDARRPD